MEVLLTIHSVEGIEEVPLAGTRITFGRTNDADVVINDSSLSRVHASINRDGDRLWIIDEGSTNGSLVNGQTVESAGMPLTDGDEIYLGNTTIVVSLKQSGESETRQQVELSPGAATEERIPKPVVIAGVSILVILFTTIVIALAYRGSGESSGITVKKYGQNVNEDSTSNVSNSSPSPSSVNSSSSPGPTLEESQLPTNSESPNSPTKRYLQMSPDEQRQFVALEAKRVSRMIGNREGYEFTPEVVSKIKGTVDAYARRLYSPKPSGGCNMRHDLTTLLNRARSYAPIVIKAFNEKGLSPQVGIYLAMIEAEYCPCLSSGTGPKGYFQFASSTARRYGVKDVSSWRDTRPDDRCNIEIMAPIAAQYMKDLITMFGTGPLSVPLAVASYNQGEGGLSVNLSKALNAARTSANPERSFWTMVAQSEILSDQFQRENIKYVPHFFAAAIVGENPRVFGVELLPLSSYAQQPKG